MNVCKCPPPPEKIMDCKNQRNQIWDRRTELRGLSCSSEEVVPNILGGVIMERIILGS